MVGAHPGSPVREQIATEITCYGHVLKPLVSVISNPAAPVVVAPCEREPDREALPRDFRAAFLDANALTATLPRSLPLW